MAKYNKSWGSVSTNFTKTTVPSSAARESKAAEDKYQKEMDQLRSMKDVAAFESKQAQTSASMASKSAEYELQSLTKFSSSLNTFLNTTGKDMYAKAQAEDLQKHIDKYESSDLKDQEAWDKKQSDLEAKIAQISENNAKRAQLQEDLRKHNLTSPNDIDPAGLSGNEKLAYITVKSKDTLANVGVNYDSWINDPNAEPVEVTWRPKIPVLDPDTGAPTGKYDYEKIPRASVNHPDGKKRLKQLFYEKVMKENPMGGLKNEWKTLILAGPLRKQLSGIQAKETQQYNKDQAKIKDEASDQASFNFILGVNGSTHTPDPNLSQAANDAAALKNRQGILEGVTQSKRFNYTKHSGETYRQGVKKWVNKSLQQVTELTDGDKIEEAREQLKLLFYKTPIPSGPNKGKTMIEAFPDLINEFDISKQVANAIDTRRTRQDKRDVDIITSSRLTEMNQIKSDIESAKTPEAKEQAINKGKERLSNWQKQMGDKYKTEAALVAIFAQSEDPEFSAMLKNEDDWRAKVDDLHKIYSGVIPLKEVGFMPNDIREKLENEGHRFVRTIPGAENERQTEATKQTMIMLKKELRQSEVESGQKKTNGDSAVIDDLMNDTYHKLLQGFMIDDEMQWTDAESRAKEIVLDLIRAGRNHDPTTTEIIEGADHPLKGQKNPFIVKPDKSGSAWANSNAMQTHRTNRQRLLTYPEAQYRHADREYASISRERKVDVNKDYLFTPIQFDKSKSPGDEGYIQLNSLQHLGLTLGGVPGPIMTHQASRLGIDKVGSVLEFRKAQRNALIAETGGISSPIWSDPILIKAWGLPNKEQWEAVQNKNYMDSLPKLPYIK